MRVTNRKESRRFVRSTHTYRGLPEKVVPAIAIWKAFQQQRRRRQQRCQQHISINIHHQDQDGCMVQCLDGLL